MGLTWWDGLTKWSGWTWPGWVALGAIGTVGALFFLAVQTRTVGRQLTFEIRDRRQQQEAFWRDHTPYLSIEGGRTERISVPTQGGQTGLQLRISNLLHADGEGTARSVEVLFSKVTDNGLDHLTAVQVGHIRARETRKVDLICPANLGGSGPEAAQFDVSFQNQYDQTIRFTQDCSVDKWQLVADVPKYKWPWQ